MSRRRFIAGAVCPRCAKMDTIVVDMDADLRECVDCGFQEGRPQAPVASELPTRVSRGLSRRTETPAEPVRLMDPSFGVKKDS
jgi:uncharacterized metal-binding protein (TIGR02443 family)